MNDTRFVSPDAAGIDYPSTIPAPRRSEGPGAVQSREDPAPLRCEHTVSWVGMRAGDPRVSGDTRVSGAAPSPTRTPGETNKTAHPAFPKCSHPRKEEGGEDQTKSPPGAGRGSRSIKTSPGNALARGGSLTQSAWLDPAEPSLLPAGQDCTRAPLRPHRTGKWDPWICVTHSQPWPRTDLARLAGAAETGSPLGDNA